MLTQDLFKISVKTTKTNYPSFENPSWFLHKSLQAAQKIQEYSQLSTCITVLQMIFVSTLISLFDKILKGDVCHWTILVKQTSCNAVVSWGLLSSNASLDCCLSFFNREVTKEQHVNKKIRDWLVLWTDKLNTEFRKRYICCWLAMDNFPCCVQNQMNNTVHRVASWDYD